MAVIRVNKTKNYTIMSNTHLNDKEMSLKAKGLLSLMLSLPDNWDYSIAGLVTLSKDGKDSVMNTLSELENFGYLKRTKLTDSKGRFAGYDYDVFENPNTVKPDEGKPYSEKPNAEKPNAEKPNAENPTQLNTNISNTKISKTKELNTELNNNIKLIIDHLNEKAGTAYRDTTKGTVKALKSLLTGENPYTVEDCITVIDKQCVKWIGTEYEQYLRPSTLFGSKFENYLNGKAKQIESKTIGWQIPDEFMV